VIIIFSAASAASCSINLADSRQPIAESWGDPLAWPRRLLEPFRRPGDDWPAALLLAAAQVGKHGAQVACKLLRVRFTRPADFGEDRVRLHGKSIKRCAAVEPRAPNASLMRPLNPCGTDESRELRAESQERRAEGCEPEPYLLTARRKLFSVASATSCSIEIARRNFAPAAIGQTFLANG
jgi:hypothetical protein